MKSLSSLNFALMLPPLLLLSACGSSSISNPQIVDAAAVIATRTSDYDSGAVSLADIEAPFTADNNLPPNDTSDIVVRSGGDHYFVIQNFGTDKIQRFEAATPTVATWIYSTQDPSDTANKIDSNPYDIIILNSTKAYLLRYGSGSMWIVNPSATTEADFKIGEIDLSGYDSDGVPEMAAGVIKNGLLYVAMQRLQDYVATQDSYVAVIDTSTDQEITTNTGTSGLKGIDLPVQNVSQLVLVPGSGDILAIAAGGYDSNFNPTYTGGIVSINSTNYTASLVLDDGTTDTHPYGQFGALAVATSDRAYFIGSTGYAANQTLYRFDAGSTAPTPVAVTGFGNLELGTVAVDPNGNLWLSQTSASTPGATVLGFVNGAETVINPLINTSLIPLNIDFLSVPVAPATGT